MRAHFRDRGGDADALYSVGCFHTAHHVPTSKDFPLDWVITELVEGATHREI